jgi:HlyD family secretion protein
MNGRRLSEIVRYLQRVVHADGASASGDGELLERYAVLRDEAAFELLLWRHGVMVLNVCRRILDHEQDAEDAFQATFLALARKARSIRRGTALAGWLYRVAFRVALAAKERARRRAAQETPTADVPAEQPNADPTWNELRQILDAEIERLPARYRLPIVLCYLEGKTNAEAARQLGCAAGTIFSRLSRARELLRSRLARRGVKLGSLALTALLAGNTAMATPGSALVGATLKAAALFAAGKTAGVSVQISTLVEGVLKAMFLGKIKTVAAFILLAGFVAVGGVLTHQALRADQPVDPDAARRLPAPAVQNRDAIPVHVARPVQGGLDREIRQPCSLEAFETVAIFSSLAGVLKAQTVDIGSPVKKGDILAQIDVPFLNLEIDQAKAAVEQARARFEVEESNVVLARAELEASKGLIHQRQAELLAAKSNLQYRAKQLDRFKQLAAAKAVETELVNQETNRLEAAKAQETSAKGALAAAESGLLAKEAKIKQVAAELNSARAGVRIAEAALAKVKLKEDYAISRAPFDGVITQRNFNVGSYIRSGDQATKPLLVLQRMDVMRAVVNVPGNDVPMAKVGTPVTIRVGSLGKEFHGRISRVAASLSGASGTMRAEIDLPNPGGVLLSGMYGEASIVLEKSGPVFLRLPRSCLVRPDLLSKDGSITRNSVYVVRDGKARLVDITTGKSSNSEVDVLSGLEPSDQVVVDPGAFTKNDIPVRVEPKK